MQFGIGLHTHVNKGLLLQVTSSLNFCTEECNTNSKESNQFTEKSDAAALTIFKKYISL